MIGISITSHIVVKSTRFEAHNPSWFVKQQLCGDSFHEMWHHNCAKLNYVYVTIFVFPTFAHCLLNPMCKAFIDHLLIEWE